MNIENNFTLKLKAKNIKGPIEITEEANSNFRVFYKIDRDLIHFFSEIKTNFPGILLLISNSSISIHEIKDDKEDLSRLLQSKTWWNQILFLTAKYSSWSQSELDYLKSQFEQIGKEHHVLIGPSKRTKEWLNSSEYVSMNYIVDITLAILKILGIYLFNNEHSPNSAMIFKKKEIKAILKNKNIHLDQFNFATSGKDQNEYWINPNKTALSNDWDLVLYDTPNQKLIYLFIPENTFKKDTFISKNREKFDLRLDYETLIDRFSKINFKPFIMQEILL